MGFARTFRGAIRIESELGRQILAEFWGTFILVTFAIGSGAQYVLSRQQLSSFLTVNMAGGMGLTLGIYWAGGVSAGSLNPAVTLTLCLKGVIPWFKWPFYTVANLAGAFFAASVQYGIYHDAIAHFDGGKRSTYGPNATAGIFSTFPQEYVSTTNCFFDQVFGTFILCGCILAIIDKRNMMPDKGFLPVALGLIVFAIGTCWALNCGYAINPARDLGPRIFTAIAGWGIEPFSYRNYNWFWVPIVGPMVGSFLSWCIYYHFIEVHWPEMAEETSVEVKTGEVRTVTAELEVKSNGVAGDDSGYVNQAFTEDQSVTTAVNTKL